MYSAEEISVGYGVSQQLVEQVAGKKNSYSDEDVNAILTASQSQSQPQSTQKKRGRPPKAVSASAKQQQQLKDTPPTSGAANAGTMEKALDAKAMMEGVQMAQRYLGVKYQMFNTMVNSIETGTVLEDPQLANIQVAITQPIVERIEKQTSDFFVQDGEGNIQLSLQELPEISEVASTLTSMFNGETPSRMLSAARDQKFLLNSAD